MYNQTQARLLIRSKIYALRREFNLGWIDSETFEEGKKKIQNEIEEK